jgi:hypothetical protein
MFIRLHFFFENMFEFKAEVPAKFFILRLNPLIVLSVGVDEGEQEEMLSPHSQQVAPHLFYCFPVLQGVFNFV